MKLPLIVGVAVGVAVGVVVNDLVSVCEGVVVDSVHEILRGTDQQEEPTLFMHCHHQELWSRIALLHYRNRIGTQRQGLEIEPNLAFYLLDGMHVLS